jgi:RimJ/RimL family protein N-acetyltransferase
MRELRRSGIRRVVAAADPAQPAAERWLERLGFSPVEVDGTTIYLWQV